MNNLRFATVSSPVGDLWLTAEEDFVTGLWFDQPRRIPDLTDFSSVDASDDPVLSVLKDMLEEYFDGNASIFDETDRLKLKTTGTEMQRAVWEELRHIPTGDTRTYGDIARAIGRPKSFRPVGQAVGHNPISIVIPCHRVIGADGSLTGFGGGLERKIVLLKNEGVLL